jgi:hypothetical protein
VDDLRRTGQLHLSVHTEFLEDVVFGASYQVRNGDSKSRRVDALFASEDLYVVQFGMNGVLLLRWSDERLRIADVMAIER